MEETYLPPFSNEENRALDNIFKELQVKLTAKSKDLLDYTDTISALNEHVSRAQREVSLATEKLVARSKQFSTDEHLYQLSLRNTVCDGIVLLVTFYTSRWHNQSSRSSLGKPFGLYLTGLT